MPKNTWQTSRSGYEGHAGRRSDGSEAPCRRSSTSEEVDMHEVLCHPQGHQEAQGMPKVRLQELQAQVSREAPGRLISDWGIMSIDESPQQAVGLVSARNSCSMTF